MRGPCTFKISDAKRTFKAMLASGLEVARVEIRKDELVIFTGKPVEAVDEQDAANEWDEVLTNAPDKKRSA